MDSYICYGDYIKQIQSDNLNQVIGGNQSVIDGIQTAAVAECISYLQQKYDTSKEFRNTVQWSATPTYTAGRVVYLNATAYNPALTYAIGVQTLYNGNVYECTTTISAPEAFTIGHWTLLGVQYEIFNSVYPQPIFNYLTIYKVGDQVFWNDKTYTCKIKTQVLSHDDLLQIGQTLQTNIVNTFPDDTVNGVKYWGVGTDYNVPASTDILNTTYWAQGDTRDQKLLMVCIDIALFHAHSRISPRNIPDLRLTRYMGEPHDRHAKGQIISYPTYCALGWLQNAARGNDITPALPLLQPLQGKRIRYGGNTKAINTY